MSPSGGRATTTFERLSEMDEIVGRGMGVLLLLANILGV